MLQNMDIQLVVLHVALVVLHCFCQEARYSTGETEECVKNYIPVVLPKLSTNPELKSFHFQVTDQVFHVIVHPIVSGVITTNTKITIYGPDGYHKELDGFRFSPWYFFGIVMSRGIGLNESSVAGTINENGIFTGYLVVGNVTYYLEPYKKYFSKYLSKNETYNAILFKTTDIIRCEKETSHLETVSSIDVTVIRFNRIDWSSLKKYKKEAASRISTQICELKIVGDYLFSDYVHHGDVSKIIDMIANILNKVNGIFRQLDFDYDDEPDNFGFSLKQLVLYTHFGARDYEKIENMTWNETTFFREMAIYDFSDSCAGLLFTYRYMTPGTEAYGGPSLSHINRFTKRQRICNSRNSNASQLDEDGLMTFSNSLPVNFLYNNSLASENSIVVAILHQLAHLFGSVDDQAFGDYQCHKTDLPELYASSFPVPSGDHESHFKLSPCAMDKIAEFLELRGWQLCSGDQHLIAKDQRPAVLKLEADRVTVRKRTWTERCFTIPRSHSVQLSAISSILFITTSSIAVVYSFR